MLERPQQRIDSVLDDPEVDQHVTRRLGVRSALYVPLIVRGRAIGVVIAHDKLGNTTPAFSEDDLRLAESLTARAAIAVDLSEQVSRDAMRRVVEAQELERGAGAGAARRDRPGADLDPAGAEAAEQAAASPEAAAVESLRELVVSTLQNVRRLAVELRPSALDDFGPPAVERLADTFRDQSGLTVDLEAQLGTRAAGRGGDHALPRRPGGADEHRQARRRRRRQHLLQRRNHAVQVVVEDDGAGFDPAATREDALGLAGMRERVALAGGKLRVESTPGGGTTLVAEVPIP